MYDALKVNIVLLSVSVQSTTGKIAVLVDNY